MLRLLFIFPLSVAPEIQGVKRICFPYFFYLCFLFNVGFHTPLPSFIKILLLNQAHFAQLTASQAYAVE